MDFPVFHLDFLGNRMLIAMVAAVLVVALAGTLRPRWVPRAALLPNVVPRYLHFVLASLAPHRAMVAAHTEAFTAAALGAGER